jgi:outer membrane lipoprotein-sorting protein
MKKIYAFLLATFCFAVAFSQNDPNAKKVLDGVSAKVKTFKGITANFTIKSITSKGKANGTQAGTISIKGKKYILNQTKREIICDGTFVYNYDAEGKTITKTSVDDNTNTLTPENLLSNFYDKDFTYKLISSAGNFHEIELLPVDKKKNFQKVNVFVDKAKNMITKAKVLDKSNNIIEFTLSNLNTNATIPDASFVFNKSKYPKEVEILD